MHIGSQGELELKGYLSQCLFLGRLLLWQSAVSAMLGSKTKLKCLKDVTI